MTTPTSLPSASELARINGVTFPNESADYRRARTQLLTAEIELRRNIESVAAQRRALPAGGEVTGDYRFESEPGPVDFAGLFGARDTLVVYSWMFGPQREKPCPMCTSLLSALAGEARDVEQRVALAVVARSPIARLLEFKQQRGWLELKLYTDANDNFSRDYHGLMGDEEIPAFNVFTRRDGTIRHFWSGEMGGKTADPGQDARGAPDLMPLWTILDSTPAGRGGNWYPKLDYSA